MRESNLNLRIHTCKFLRNYLKYDSHLTNIEACHFEKNTSCNCEAHMVESHDYRKKPIEWGKYIALPVYQKRIKEKVEEDGINTTSNCERNFFEH